MPTYYSPDGLSVHCDTRFQYQTSDPDIDPRTNVHISWSPSDPLAVMLEFRPGSNQSANVVWHVSRDMLAAGLMAPAGLGDVQVWPHTRHATGLLLASPTGRAEFRAGTNDLRFFLSASYHRCPRGAEYPDFAIDDSLADLFEGEAA